MRALDMQDDDIEAICSDHSKLREKIHQSLTQWQQDVQQGASRIKLIEACKHSSVQRMDLAAKLEAL